MGVKACTMRVPQGIHGGDRRAERSITTRSPANEILVNRTPLRTRLYPSLIESSSFRRMLSSEVALSREGSRRTALKQSPNVHLKPHPLGPADSPSASIQDDPRWHLVLRVAAGPLFARSPLLSKFLLYVVAETLEGRQSRISEHQIGMKVFGRPPGYSTREDNIVRNYARQLRKRLTEHFAGPGKSERMRIEIPLGGYVPQFTKAPVARLATTLNPNFNLKVDESRAAGRKPALDPGTKSESSWRTRLKPFLVQGRSESRALHLALMATAYSVALIALTWLVASHLLVHNSRQFH